MTPCHRTATVLWADLQQAKVDTKTIDILLLHTYNENKRKEVVCLRKQYVHGIAYGFVHFSVEVACFYFLYSRISTTPLFWALALLFDAVAFLPQGLFGMLTDRFPRLNIGLIGALCMLVAFPIPNDLIGLLFLASGNAMVHVSGAQHTLRDTHGKIGPNSIFVGGGSFGVVTGQLLGGLSNPVLAMIPLLLMLLSCMIIIWVHQRNDLSGRFATFQITAPKSMEFLVIFAVLAVTVRGYVAYAIPTEWNKSVPQTVALFVCMGIGKTLGGILCDRLGYRKVTYLSLLVGLPFLLGGNSNMALSLIGIALFSMTMPVTVAILVSVFPKQPGFAFGLTTLGLFLGVAPAFFIRPETLLAHQIVVVILTAMALPAVLLCIKKGK